MPKKLGQVKYYVPGSVDEVFKFMEMGDNTRVLAGNTLLNELGKRDLLSEVDAFIDISRVPLNFVNEDNETGRIRIGALTTFTELLNEAFVHKPELQALKQALLHVRPVQVRNAATIGGCVGAGLPFLDVPIALLALNAKINVASSSQMVNLVEYDTLFSSISGGIGSGQLITEVVLPSFSKSALSRYSRFSTTGMGEAIVNVSIMVCPDQEDGNWKEVSVAVGGAGVDMGRMNETESCLKGECLDRAALERAVRSITKEAKISSDLNGSAEFKRRVLAATFERMLASLGGI